MQVIVKAGSLSDRECLRLAVRSGTLRARRFLACYGVPVTCAARSWPPLPPPYRRTWWLPYQIGRH